MRRQFPELSLHDELFIVGFSGLGGACEGIAEALGRNVDAAMNHAWEAIAVHMMNHPETLHFLKDIWEVDPLEVLAKLGWRRVGGAWFSPDCKHFSKAKGAALIDKAIRSLAWVLKMWARRGGGRHGTGPACPRVLYLENVEEFQTWGPLIAKRCPDTGRVVRKDGTVAARGERVPYHDQALVPDPKRAGEYFRALIADLAEVGGVAQWREIRACVYGTPTIRKRLYLVVRFDGRPHVWPEETHGDPESDEVKAGELDPYHAIAECLDFHLPCPSLFLTKEQAKAINAIRPLAEKSEARTAKGVDRYVLKSAKPFIICLTHQGNDGVESIDVPGKTVTGANRGERALVMPVIAHAQHKGAVRSAAAPLHTIAASTKDQNQVIFAHVVKMHGDPATHNPGQPVTAPAHNICAGGNHFALIAAFLAQHNTGMVGHHATDPASTISSKGSQQQLVALSLSKYYGADQDPRMEEPGHSVTTKDRFALIEAILNCPPFTPELEADARRVAAFLRKYGVEFEGEFATVTVAGFCLVLTDLGMRMLTPRELARAQGFPDSFILDRGVVIEDGARKEVKITRTAQVRLVGNSVCPPVARALVAANNPEMRIEEVAA